MLHEFLTAHRANLIERCRAKVARRPAPGASDAELAHGVSAFLDQLIRTLRVEQTAEPMRSRQVSGPAGGGTQGSSEMGETATLHGRELLRRGFTVDQVVHDYGDLCQAITDLAFELGAPIGIDEFRTLNRCLDNAIAQAVTEFSYQREALIVDKTVKALNERLGLLAHDLRNHLQTATLALTAVRAGSVGLSGATGAILSHSLVRLRTLLDQSLADVRITAGMPARHGLFSLADFISEVQISASLEALTRECGFTVERVDPKLALDGDRDLLFSALGNVLQNAFKFTSPHSVVSLRAFASDGRILIDVEDHCGGLPPGDREDMFLPFKQIAADKSGLGLGLSISRRSVEANDGTLEVRDLPGSGCIFTIDLPRHELPVPA
jgi:hypothetical protein